MFEQQVDIGLIPVSELDFIEQIRKMLPQVLVNEAVFLQFEGVQVEDSNNFGRKVFCQEISGNFQPGEGFTKEAVVGVLEFAHVKVARKPLFGCVVWPVRWHICGPARPHVPWPNRSALSLPPVGNRCAANRPLTLLLHPE